MRLSVLGAAGCHWVLPHVCDLLYSYVVYAVMPFMLVYWDGSMFLYVQHTSGLKAL